MSELKLRNRQTVRVVALARFRGHLRWLLEELLACRHYQLAVHLVGLREITALNRQYLRHEGPTDVIAFDHLTALRPLLPPKPDPGPLYGEIFICMAEAVRQARKFRTSWQAELARYVIHALLHLRGYQDDQPAARRLMKREEDRLLKLVAGRRGRLCFSRRGL